MCCQSKQRGLGPPALVLQLAQLRPQRVGVQQRGRRAVHDLARRCRVRGVQAGQRAVQRHHASGQDGVAGIVRGHAVAEGRRALELRQPAPSLEEEQVVHRGARLLLQLQQLRLQRAARRGRRLHRIAGGRVHEHDGPAAPLEQRVLHHHVVDRIPGQALVAALGPHLLPLRARHQAAHGLAHHGRAVREALQRTQAHPVGPGHQSHAQAHARLLRNLERGVADGGAGEQLRAPEARDEVVGQPAQLLVAGAARVPPRGPRPP
jgi:hypothetical protein